MRGRNYSLCSTLHAAGNNSGCVVARLDRKRLGADCRGRSGISIRGVFDKETRRKPLAFAADAAAMDFESSFASGDELFGRSGMAAR